MNEGVADDKEWEHVSFINPSWKKSQEWEIRWRKADNHDRDWCNNKIDDNLLTTGIWNVTETFWNNDTNTMLLDIERPFSVAPNTAPINDEKLELDPETPFNVMLSYGVFKDKGDKDGNRNKGDRDVGKHMQIISILDGASHLAIATFSLVATSVSFMM